MLVTTGFILLPAETVLLRVFPALTVVPKELLPLLMELLEPPPPFVVMARFGELFPVGLKNVTPPPFDEPG